MLQTKDILPTLTFADMMLKKYYINDTDDTKAYLIIPSTVANLKKYQACSYCPSYLD